MWILLISINLNIHWFIISFDKKKRYFVMYFFFLCLSYFFIDYTLCGSSNSKSRCAITLYMMLISYTLFVSSLLFSSFLLCYFFSVFFRLLSSLGLMCRLVSIHTQYSHYIFRTHTKYFLLILSCLILLYTVCVPKKKIKIK